MKSGTPAKRARMQEAGAAGAAAGGARGAEVANAPRATALAGLGVLLGQGYLAGGDAVALSRVTGDPSPAVAITVTRERGPHANQVILVHPPPPYAMDLEIQVRWDLDEDEEFHKRGLLYDFLSSLKKGVRVRDGRLIREPVTRVTLVIANHASRSLASDVRFQFRRGEIVKAKAFILPNADDEEGPQPRPFNDDVIIQSGHILEFSLDRADYQDDDDDPLFPPMEAELVWSGMTWEQAQGWLDKLRELRDTGEEKLQ